MAGKYELCPTCNEYGWVDTHTCAPIWHCAQDMSPHAKPWTERPELDEFREVRARDSEHAAEKFTELLDCEGDYVVVSRGQSARIWVASLDGEISKWEVTGEAVPTYYGHPAKEAT